MKLLGDAVPLVTAGNAFADTQAAAAATSVENDFAATGLPTSRAVGRAAAEDYQDAAGLVPTRATAGPLGPGAAASPGVSNITLYGAGAVGLIALALFLRAR